MSTLAQSTNRPAAITPDNTVDTGNAMSTNSLSQVEGGRTNFMARLQSAAAGVMLGTAALVGGKQEASAATVDAPTTNAVAANVPDSSFRFYNHPGTKPAEAFVSTNQPPPAAAPAPAPAPAVAAAQLVPGVRNISQTEVKGQVYSGEGMKVHIAECRTGLFVQSPAGVVQVMSEAVKNAVTEAEKNAKGGKVDLDQFIMKVSVRNGTKGGDFEINPKNLPDSANIDQASYQAAVSNDGELYRLVKAPAGKTDSRIILEVTRNSPDSVNFRYVDANRVNAPSVTVEFKQKAAPPAPAAAPPAPGAAPAPAAPAPAAPAPAVSNKVV